MIGPEYAEVVPDFADFGIRAFTTTRAFGTLSSATTERAHVVAGRWGAVRDAIKSEDVERLATAHQVHGKHVIAHAGNWKGWLRAGEADGHFALQSGTALAVTVADCVPIFMAHHSGAVAL